MDDDLWGAILNGFANPSDNSGGGAADAGSDFWGRLLNGFTGEAQQGQGAGDTQAAATANVPTAPGTFNGLRTPQAAGRYSPIGALAAVAGNTQGAVNARDSSGQAGGWLQRLLAGDPAVQKQMQMGLSALGLLGSAATRNSARGRKSPQELRGMLSSPLSNWNPQQQQAANAYFNSGPRQFTYQPPNVGGLARGGALAGLTGGQDDVVPIKAANGEYVLDADTVSALGDGNSAAGAAKLDVMRANLRAHKRAAPLDSIPPRAKSIQAYMLKRSK